MEKEKQTKLMVILALCVSVVGLAIGFAAFSNTLTISSSATVSPNASDFNINVYGIENMDGVTTSPTHNLYTSTKFSVPLMGYNGVGIPLSATPAKINDQGSSITISDINVGLSKPGQSASYYFMVKNEGQYDAYVFWKEWNLVDYDCILAEGTTPELAEKACQDVTLYVMGEFSDGTQIYDYEDSYVKIAKGDYIIIEVWVDYMSSDVQERADGDFSLDYDDIEFEFTSVEPYEYQSIDK